MKRLIFLLILILGITNTYAQKEKTESDTTKLKFGNRTIIIIENKKDPNEVKVEVDEDIVISKEGEEEVVVKEKKSKYKAGKYSRWAGINLGFNQFLSINDFGPLNDDEKIWELNSWKSRTWNINIMEFSASIIKKHLLLTTGLGFEFRNYSFSNNIDLIYRGEDNINPEINQFIGYDRNKLHISYVQIPLLLEINTSPRPKKGVYLAAGIIGGYKMTSRLTQKYNINGQKIEVSIHDDFNLNQFQLDGTVRVGFNRFTLFTNFDMLPVFKEGKSDTGDQLSNVTLGIQLLGF